MAFDRMPFRTLIARDLNRALPARQGLLKRLRIGIAEAIHTRLEDQAGSLLRFLRTRCPPSHRGAVTRARSTTRRMAVSAGIALALAGCASTPPPARTPPRTSRPAMAAVAQPRRAQRGDHRATPDRDGERRGGAADAADAQLHRPGQRPLPHRRRRSPVPAGRRVRARLARRRLALGRRGRPQLGYDRHRAGQRRRRALQLPRRSTRCCGCSATSPRASTFHVTW